MPIVIKTKTGVNQSLYLLHPINADGLTKHPNLYPATLNVSDLNEVQQSLQASSTTIPWATDLFLFSS